MSFVPKVIPGGRTTDEGALRPARTAHEMIDINRISQAFFRIQSNEIRQRIVALIEEVADSQHSENWF